MIGCVKIICYLFVVVKCVGVIKEWWFLFLGVVFFGCFDFDDFGV